MGTGGTSDATARPSGGTGYSAHIDRGRFSDIFVARQRSTGLVCALKVVKLSGDPWPSYQENEETILKQIGHLNIVQLYSVHLVSLQRICFAYELLDSTLPKEEA